MSNRLTFDRPALIDTSLVERAFALAKPTIDQTLSYPEVSGERLLHVVVLNPLVTPGTSSFDEAVLAEHSFGAAPPWGADYRGFARAKAQLAWRLQSDTRYVQQNAPWLIKQGETCLSGSACRDGLIVAASGAHSWWDEALCGVLVELIRGLAFAHLQAEPRPE